jgi:hypothetical protein
LATSSAILFTLNAESDTFFIAASYFVVSTLGVTVCAALSSFLEANVFFFASFLLRIAVSESDAPVSPL